MLGQRKCLLLSIHPVKLLSHVQLFAIPGTVAHQAPPSTELPRQECWSGLPFSSPGDLPYPGIEPTSTALQAVALPSEPPGKPCCRPALPTSSLMHPETKWTGKRTFWSSGWKPHQPTGKLKNVLSEAKAACSGGVSQMSIGYQGNSVIGSPSSYLCLQNIFTKYLSPDAGLGLCATLSLRSY